MPEHAHVPLIGDDHAGDVCRCWHADVAYDLIPFAQRRGLHARLAESLETTLPRACATTIAFHYSKSCHAVEGAEWKRAVKAIQYWEMAAEEAMEGIDHHQVGYP